MTALSAAIVLVALGALVVIALRRPLPFIHAYRCILGAILLAAPVVALVGVVLPDVVTGRQVAALLPPGVLALLPDPQSPAFAVALAVLCTAVLLPLVLALAMRGGLDSPTVRSAATEAPGAAPHLAAAPSKVEPVGRPARDIRAAADAMALATNNPTKPQRVADYLS